MEASNPYAAPATEVRDVVPEGEAQLAGRGARLGAAILDALMMGVVVGLPSILVTGPESMLTLSSVLDYPEFLRQGNYFGVVGLLVLVGITAWLVHRNGQTIGKKLVGIKVVRDDFSRATLGRVFWLRNVPFWVASFIPFVGQIVSLVDALLIFRASRQCLHDQLAGTIVIDA